MTRTTHNNTTVTRTITDFTEETKRHKSFGRVKNVVEKDEDYVEKKWLEGEKTWVLDINITNST